MSSPRNSEETAAAPPAAPANVEYTDPDGRPRFRDATQLATIDYVADALAIHFKLTLKRPNVYFAHDLPIQYREAEQDAAVVPDLFVALGVNERRRAAYRLPEEPKPPDFALDVVTSSKEARRAWQAKPAIYARLGIRECWQYDPSGRHFAPRLRGFRLEKGRYVALAPIAEGGGITIHSAALGLDLQWHGAGLRMRDPVTGRVFPTVDEACVTMVEALEEMEAAQRYRRESEALCEEAERALRAEREARQAAEARLRAAEIALRAKRQARQEAEAALLVDRQARQKAEAALQAERQARQKAEAGLQADRQARQKAEAALQAKRQARQEAEAGLQADRQARQKAEARIPELEARIEVLLSRRARDSPLEIAPVSKSVDRSPA